MLGSFCNHGTVGNVTARVFLQSCDSGTCQCYDLSAIMEQGDTSVLGSFCNHGTVGNVTARVFLQS